MNLQSTSSAERAAVPPILRRLTRNMKKISGHDEKGKCDEALACYSDDFKRNGKAYLVVDDDPSKETLTAALHKYTSDLIRLKMMRYITNGLVVINAYNVAHRNITPDNVLVWPTGAKIINFDFAVDASDPQQTAWADKAVGDVKYRAPENQLSPTLFALGRSYFYSGAVLSLESDIWSLGMLFFYILSNGNTPWAGFTDLQIEKQLRNTDQIFIPYAHNIAEPFRPLLVGMLSRDTANRFKLVEVITFLEELVTDLMTGAPKAGAITLSRGIYHARKRSISKAPITASRISEVFAAAVPQRARTSRKRRRKSTLTRISPIPRTPRNAALLEYAYNTARKFVSRTPDTPLTRTKGNMNIVLLVWVSRLIETYRSNPKVHFVLSPPGKDDSHEISRQINKLWLWIGLRVFLTHKTKNFVGFVYNDSTLLNIISAIRDSSKKLIVFYLGLTYVRGRTHKRVSSHANFVVINKNERVIEHYDPWGVQAAPTHKIKALLETLTAELIDRAEDYPIVGRDPVKDLRHYMLSPSAAHCPYLVFQSLELPNPVPSLLQARPGEYSIVSSIKQKLRATRLQLKNEPGGYCAYWVMWLMEQRIQRPSATRDVILDDSLRYIQTEWGNFAQFIREFAGVMNDVYDHFNVTFGFAITKSQTQLTGVQYRKMLRYAKNYHFALRGDIILTTPEIEALSLKTSPVQASWLPTLPTFLSPRPAKRRRLDRGSSAVSAAVPGRPSIDLSFFSPLSPQAVSLSDSRRSEERLAELETDLSLAGGASSALGRKMRTSRT